MMRTIEVLIVIVIITGAFLAVSTYASLPWPREVSPMNLKELSLTTLQILDSNYELSKAVFETDNSTLWSQLQTSLSASLPANVVYNLTVYEIDSGSSGLYNYKTHVSNAESLGITSDSSFYMVASSNVTFNVTPQKIGEGSGGTLYILNCSDANGWWITGYTAQSLAEDLYNMLSPYFVKTVMVQNTNQLATILNGGNLTGETNKNAVIINTCGEAVPMPSAYYQGNVNASQGYNASIAYPYVQYCYTLGKVTHTNNWTWCSIVGYPFYYVSNTGVFSNQDNGWGIYGMKMTSQGGILAFLQGLDDQRFNYNDAGITSDVGVVTLTNTAIDASNYYGVYPSSYQSSSRALSNSILQNYHLSMGLNLFNPVSNYNPGAFYNHINGGTSITGSFLAIGLTRTPDVRVTALGLLSYYHPRLYASEYTSGGTSRVVVLQLGLLGGA